MMKERLFISRDNVMVFRYTCGQKKIDFEEVFENAEGYLFEVTVCAASQLFYLGREFQIDLVLIDLKTSSVTHH